MNSCVDPLAHCQQFPQSSKILTIPSPDGDPTATLAYLSYLKDMSRPENNIQALSWKKLHLSRAKLKATSRTSALLSGFAMVAMVEVQLTDEMPKSLLIIFSICTTLLVSVHLLALMISTCILPNVEAVCSVPGISTVQESPHERMHWYIEASWGFSTVLGILLFMSEIAILCWVKFYNFSTDAALLSSIILIPVVILFIAFATHFYRNLVTHKYERSEHGLRELESMATQLETNNELHRNNHHILDV